jgi:hypothetical protein
MTQIPGYAIGRKYPFVPWICLTAIGGLVICVTVGGREAQKAATRAIRLLLRFRKRPSVAAVFPVSSVAPPCHTAVVVAPSRERRRRLDQSMTKERMRGWVICGGIALVLLLLLLRGCTI